ncbi:MAG TPA: hypothetical protein VGR47_12795 [Terracidiphilus sp.]|nr:hypothetical protein [Terracidiphilus sp.]
MTEIILTFPVRRTAPLTRVWFKTGNPAQPLASRWLAAKQPAAESDPEVADSLRFRRICA